MKMMGLVNAITGDGDNVIRAETTGIVLQLIKVVVLVMTGRNGSGDINCGYSDSEDDNSNSLQQ